MLELGCFYTIDELARAHAEAGGHWFDPSARRFFRCRLSSEVVPVSDGWLFVSSEQFVSSRGRADRRRYTVRKMTPDTDVLTVGEFQQYASWSGACKAMRRLAREG